MRQNEKGNSKSGHHKPFPSPVSSLKPPSQQQAYKDFFFSMQKMKRNKKFTRTRDVTRRKYLCSAHPNLRSCSCLRCAGEKSVVCPIKTRVHRCAVSSATLEINKGQREGEREREREVSCRKEEKEMGSDFVADDASLAGFSRDIARKKKIHRSAKLKQCKLDARREQWLSQVKNKDCLVTSRGMPAAYPPPQPASSKKLDRRVKEGEKKEGVGVSVECDGSSSHDSEEGSPTHGNSLSECPGDRIGRGSSFGSSSISISDADVEGDDTEDRGEVEEEEMDDWETLADALTAHDCSQPDPTPPAPTIPDATAAPGRINNDNQDGFEKPGDRQIVHRAWKPDDTFRPQSLPNLLKQRSFPASMGRHYEAAGRAQRGILSMPSSCPICYEDLDRTDSSFLPCNCGFRLCLFCHKRIVEADGRCPGCRKHYAPMVCDEMATTGRIPTADFRLYRSCSMRSRN